MPKADTLTEVSSPMPVTPFLSPASSPKELPAIILGMPPMIYTDLWNVWAEKKNTLPNWIPCSANTATGTETNLVIR